MIKKLIAVLTLVVGLVLGTATVASATPTNVGPNTSCTEGTDHCSGWLPSAHIPCMVYNVLWDHVWVDQPGGEAWWRVQIDRYWTCNGPAYIIENVTVAYVLDTVVPKNELTGLNGSVGAVAFYARSWSGEFSNYMLGGSLGYTRNVLEWSRCRYDQGSGATDGMSHGVFMSAAPGWNILTYAAGYKEFAMACQANANTNAIRQVSPFGGTGVVNGSYVAWVHGNINDSAGTPHSNTRLILW